MLAQVIVLCVEELLFYEQFQDLFWEFDAILLAREPPFIIR